MTPPRVVPDTDVLVSALLFTGGSLSWLRAAWQSGAVVPLASRETTTELIRVLGCPKFRLTAQEGEDLLADYLPWCKAITLRTDIEVPDCRDPFDRPFLEVALSGRADALVTGDGDLLALAPTFPVPILSPHALQSLLRRAQGQ